MNSVNVDGPRRMRWLLGTIVLGLVFLACGIIFPEQAKAPPQGWLESRGPVVPHDTFPADCSLCHVGEGWHHIADDFRFDHLAAAGTPLTGAHSAAECLRCHNDKGPVDLFARRGCGGCHLDVHSGLLGFNCNDCHGEDNWQPKAAIVRHNNETRFPLIGAHAGVACYECHGGAHIGNYRQTDTHCEACHQADLAQATNPDHIATGWTQDCQRCHRPTTWGGQGFTHSTFPLTGAHATTACAACHIGGVFAGTPRNCVDCHQTDYNNTNNPNHQAAGYSTSCQVCHNTTSWNGALFDHSSFPLTGAHVPLACAQCHQGGVFQGTPNTCVGCHQTDYNNTNNPDHQASGFSTDCQTCHSTNTWQGAVFNHRFPLNGNHNVSCATCHTVPGNIQMFDCLGCHEHRQSKMDDVHSGTSGYVYSSPACVNCHPNGRH